MSSFKDKSVSQEIGFAENAQELLMAVSRVSAAISGLGNLDAVLKIGLDTTLKLMNGQAGGIMLLNEENGHLYYRVSQGFSQQYFEEMYMKPGEGIAGRVAQSGKAVLIDDISKDPHAARPDLISMEGLKAFASVPLKAKEEVLGVMNCTRQNPYSFTQMDIYLLQSIGDQLGIAIEQAKLQESLRRSRERYRQLTRQLMVAQEEERKKIARNLHDETSQILASLSLNMQALIEMAADIGIQDSKFMDILQRSHSYTVQIHSEVSRLISDLRPTQLDTLGLVAAVRQHLHLNLEPQGLEVEYDLDPLDIPLQSEEELNLFRWVQGAVGNILQHSRAEKVKVSIKQLEEEILIKIKDDGVGFDSDMLPDMRKLGRGYGLLNMKERMHLIGGSCSVKSQPGEGTTVEAHLPIANRSRK